MANDQTYTSEQAARLGDLSTYMVHYLCRERLLEPSGRSARGRGKRRAYTFGDVVMLRALARFLKSGISVANLKRSLRELRKRHPEITPNSLPSKFVVSDGKQVYFRNRHEALESLDGSGQFVFAFVIELRQLRDEVLERDIGDVDFRKAGASR